MNDEERQAYYDRKVKKADDTAWLLARITFLAIVGAIGYATGVFLVKLWG